MRLKLISVILLILLGLPVSGWAFDAAQNDYIQAQFLPPRLLPPPPLEGSMAWKHQIDGVLQAQKDLSASTRAAIRDEQKVRLALLTPILGPDFTREKLPKTFAFLDRILVNTSHIVSADKNYFHTRRPYLTDHRVKLWIDPIDDNPSYPSGHTAETRVMAEVLGMLFPDKQDALRARADAIAQHRIEAGAHYPVDIEGGKMLAMLITGALIESEDFQDDLVAVQKELANR